MKNVKVTVVIPFFNGEKYIKKCAESIVSQTYKNIEILFIDDGSVDSAPMIINEIAKKDKRVRCKKQINSGVSHSRNVGIQESTGEYIIFVDADDYLAPDFVEFFVSLVEANDSDFCFSTCCYKTKNEKQSRKTFTRIISNEEAISSLLSPEVVVGCWNKIYKTDFLRRNNLFFNEELFYGEGLNFIISSAVCAKNIVCTNRKLYFYRKNNTNSATSSVDIGKIKNGEFALCEVKRKIPSSFKRANRFFDIHFCNYCIGATTNLISSKMNKTHDSCYHNLRGKFKKLALKCFFYKETNIYRKSLFLCGLFFPHLLSFLDKKRKKDIVAKSIE